MKKQLIIGLVIILAILLVESLQFNNNPILGSISQNSLTSIRSSENIYCRWNESADTTYANVSWYKNGVSYINNTVYDEEDMIDYTLTTEEDTWNCTVMLVNSTGDTLNASASIYVHYDPLVFIEGAQANKTYNLTEDSIYTTIWNTTESVYDYAISAGGMCDLEGGGTIGNATCNPANSNLGSDKNTSGTQIVIFKYSYGAFGENTQGHRVNFTINPVNDAPTFTLTNTTINETETYEETINVTDEESNFPINFTVDFTTAASFCSYTNTSNSITLNCTPTPTDIGNHTISIFAEDNPPNNGFGLVSENVTHNMTLEVLAVNHNPNITYYSNTPASQGDDYNITINATDEFDNNSLEFTITSSCGLTNPWTGVINTTTVVNESGNITSYGNATWSGTLTNDHIVCRDVTITVDDGRGGTDAENVLLNISNTNDAPELFNYSTALDQLNNVYIYNITGYRNAPLLYQINGTDIDLLVTYNAAIDSFEENLTYVTNETTDPWIRNSLDNQTGLVNISAANMNRTGNYSILITLVDVSGLNDTMVMNVEVKNNSNPYFNDTLSFTCFEFDSDNYNQNCILNLSYYAKDDDVSDYVMNYSDNSALFDITDNGIINFTANQGQVGEYNINITITDSKGATNTSNLYLEINNTNNAPVLGSITVPTPPSPMIQGIDKNNVINLPVTDADTSLTGTDQTKSNYSYENLNLSVTGDNATVLTYLTIDNGAGTLTVDTDLGIGTYEVTIIVTDNYFNFTGQSTYDNDTQNITFTIYNGTSEPDITSINPYGGPWSATTVFGWWNLSIGQPSNITYINVSENTTVLFNHTNEDDQPDNLTFYWYYDDVQITNISWLLDGNKSLNYSFDFFETSFNQTGNHILELVIIDGFDSTLNDSFIWDINVTDVNRPLVLKENIPNITITGTRNVDNKDLFWCLDTYGFYDPDFDVDGNGALDCAESNFTITYNITNSSCALFASIDVSSPYSTGDIDNESWILGHGITATALNDGSCNITITASDGEYYVDSNVIIINTTVVASPDPVIITVSSGTRTRTETITIPYPEEVEKPIPIDIILPDMVTVYEDNIIEIPLTITNTWTDTIYGITLDYKMNNSLNMSVRFLIKNFFKIEPGEEIKTSMFVSNYRVGGVYEIIILANVTEPEYVDSAKIYINSLEQTTSGAQVKTLISFAKDLLSRNKECQELYEILDKAEGSYKVGLIERALEEVHSVINGCKYLIGEEQRNLDFPRRFRDIHFELKKEYLGYLLIAGMFIVIVLGSIKVFSKKKD